MNSKDKTCTKKTTIVDKEKASSTTKYSCKDGYTLNGKKCTKTSIKDVKVTYYRYATRTCDGGETSIKWSTENDESLLNDGYKLTGNKREIKSNK